MRGYSVTVTVRVRLFAALREAAGSGDFTLDVPEGATVGDVWASLQGRIGRADRNGGSATPAPAVNRRVVELTAVVADGDEIAFLPPVSGG